MKESNPDLLSRARACRACTDLPLGPRPVVQAHSSARVLIVGQAPGLKVHRSGIPWDDASGERLRDWLSLSSEKFYDPKSIAVLPVGFCYPGRAASGDAPPPKACFDLWHGQFGEYLKNLELTLLVGRHAQVKYLGAAVYPNGTETIRRWREYLPKFCPLPHPSPRNNIWLHKNPWFDEEVVPEIRVLVERALCRPSAS